MAPRAWSVDQPDARSLGRFLSITEDGAGGVRLRGRGTVEDAAALKAALLPLTKPAPAVDVENPDCEVVQDPRDHGARLWDALVQACEHALATDLPPDCHGARPRVTVTTSLEVLRGQIDWATLGTAASTTEDGLELAPSVVRRLACDADIIPVALGGKGEVLDVGRTAPPRHPAALAGRRVPGPALRVPGLHPAPDHVPRPPHHPLGRRRRDQAREPRSHVRAAPPGHPPHPVAGPDQPRRRQTGVPPTDQGRAPTPGLDQKQAPPRVGTVRKRTHPPPSQTGEGRGLLHPCGRQRRQGARSVKASRAPQRRTTTADGEAAARRSKRRRPAGAAGPTDEAPSPSRKKARPPPDEPGHRRMNPTPSSNPCVSGELQRPGFEPQAGWLRSWT